MVLQGVCIWVLTSRMVLKLCLAMRPSRRTPPAWMTIPRGGEQGDAYRVSKSAAAAESRLRVVTCAAVLTSATSREFTTLRESPLMIPQHQHHVKLFICWGQSTHYRNWNTRRLRLLNNLYSILYTFANNSIDMRAEWMLQKTQYRDTAFLTPRYWY